MKRANRKPVAVVNDLFSRRRKKYGALLKGFEEIILYKNRKQHRAVPDMLRIIDDVKEEPFFAWFHLFALHNPYYCKKGVQRDGTAPFPVRYRNALKWIDGELKKLFRGFEQRGIKERTVFILTADHGEGLGDHGLNTHGSYIFEEETRVPFYMLIPGRGGVTINATVSLIDLVATLADMVGHPVKKSDGVSLLPLIENPKQKWDRYYYLENSLNNHIGIVRNRAKLLYMVDSQTMHRFNLEKDKREKRNRFELNNPSDQLLLSHLIYHRPDHFIDALSDGRVKSLYDQLLERRETLSPDAVRLLQRIEDVRRRGR